MSFTGETSTKRASCTSCRRRKLKCTRELTGCAACIKSELTCIYSQSGIGIRGKRGPYKRKDEIVGGADVEISSKCIRRTRSNSPPTLAVHPVHQHSIQEESSEGLLNDALSTLAQVDVSEVPLSQNVTTSTVIDISACQKLRIWQLFIDRVDKVTKLIHCPSFADTYFSSIERSATGSNDLLILSISYAAICSCHAKECSTLLGHTKTDLLTKYEAQIENDIVQSHIMPDLQFMQALVLYLVCICRARPTDTSSRLFIVTVRNAQLMGLHLEPSTTSTPYEAELRKRLWWTICACEASCSEEGVTRNKALFIQESVSMPANLEDHDLTLSTKTYPKARAGITSMSFVLIRWEIMITNVKLWTSRRTNNRLQIQEEFRRRKDYLQKQYLQHCHESRPFDFMIMTVADVMMTKCCLTIEQVKDMSVDQALAQDRMRILRPSVNIIQKGYQLISDARCFNYQWFFRSYLQWHSLATVIAELSHSSNSHLVQTAWEVLKPFMKIWDRVYEKKVNEDTWDRVNLMIQNAKASAQSAFQKPNALDEKATNCTGGMFPFSTFAPPEEHCIPETMTTANLPLPDIDFDAFDTVFSSSDWENMFMQET